MFQLEGGLLSGQVHHAKLSAAVRVVAVAAAAVGSGGGGVAVVAAVAAAVVAAAAVGRGNGASAGGSVGKSSSCSFMIGRGVGCFGLLLCLVRVTQKPKFISYGMVGFQD